MHQSTERLLIARVRAGDPIAERTFYDMYVATVYRVALQITHDSELARDCTQETFIRAFTHLSQFRSDGPVGAWLRKVTLSVVRNMWRKEASWQDRTVALDELEVMTESDELECHDRHDLLRRALARLPSAHRQMLLLYYSDGYTHPAIAVRLGISVTASKSRLLRARIQLRYLLGVGADQSGAVSKEPHRGSFETSVA